MKKVIFILILLFGSSVSLFSQTVNGEIVSDSGNVTVVKLWGTSEERGFALGYLLGDKISAIAEGFIVPFYGNHIEEVRELIEEGTSIVIDSVYQDEAKAVISGMDAAGFNPQGYDYLDILAGNIFNDMYDWPFSKDSKNMQCSAFMNWNDATFGTDLNGCSVISRHLDNAFIPDVCYSNGSIVVHIPSEEGQQPWLIVDFGGPIAPTSGINQSGYSIFQNGMGWSWDPDTTAPYVPVRFMMRKVLESNDYNGDDAYNMHDIRDAISDNEQGYATGKIFCALGPSTSVYDSLIALITEVAPEYPFITFRTNSYNDSIPGDNLYAANDEIARNNSHNYCLRYYSMIDTIGDGYNISSEANWEMMRIHSNGGYGNLMFMQFIPEWNQLKLSICQKINGINYPAYTTEPVVYDLSELFSLSTGVPGTTVKNYALDLTISPNPFSDYTSITFELAEPISTEIKIFNQIGHLVKKFDLAEGKVGLNKVTWQANELTPGIYFIRLQTAKTALTGKAIKMK
jgi:hypothetical protein